jgi:hypothetical protein
MTSISTTAAITLGGGELVCGIALTITTQLAYTYGLTQIGIKNETKRQIMLNLVCLIAIIATIISTGLNATAASPTASNITVFTSFVLIQYGHVILNHNTIIRGSRMIEMFVPNAGVNRDLVDNVCFFLYLLPPIVMIPIYLAFKETAGTNLPMNKSHWNSVVYKLLNVGLTVTTEFFAILTDIYFIMQVKRNSKMSKANMSLSHDMYVTYIITWLFFIADIILKSIIYSGLLLLFDNQLSICTLAMRARCNLQFGLELRSLTGFKSKVNLIKENQKPSEKESARSLKKNANRHAAHKIDIPMESILDSRQLDNVLQHIDEVVVEGLQSNLAQIKVTE